MICLRSGEIIYWKAAPSADFREMAVRGRKRVAGSAVCWIRRLTLPKPTIADYALVRSTYPGVFGSVFGYGLNLSPNWVVLRKVIER